MLRAECEPAEREHRHCQCNTSGFPPLDKIRAMPVCVATEYYGQTLITSATSVSSEVRTLDRLVPHAWLSLPCKSDQSVEHPGLPQGGREASYKKTKETRGNTTNETSAQHVISPLSLPCSLQCGAAARSQIPGLRTFSFAAALEIKFGAHSAWQSLIHFIAAGLTLTLQPASPVHIACTGVFSYSCRCIVLSRPCTIPLCSFHFSLDEQDESWRLSQIFIFLSPSV